MKKPKPKAKKNEIVQGPNQPSLQTPKPTTNLIARY